MLIPIELSHHRAAIVERQYFRRSFSFFHVGQPTPRIRFFLWGVMLSGLVLQVGRRSPLGWPGKELNARLSRYDEVVWVMQVKRMARPSLSVRSENKKPPVLPTETGATACQDMQ